eukprot:8210598-Pyramimonas_sp.AAC.1
MTTNGREGKDIVDALAAADEWMENVYRYVLVDTRALNDPTHTRHAGHHREILHNSVDNEHFAYNAECVGRSLAKNASLQSVCIVSICRSGRHRSVAVSHNVKQFLRQCDI